MIDAFLRYPAISFLVLTALLSLRDVGHLVQGKIAAALCLSMIALLAQDIPAPNTLPPLVEAVAWYLYVPNIVLLWWFGLSLFEDGFTLNLRHWSVFAVVYGIVAALKLFEYLELSAGIYAALVANRVISLSLLAHLIWHAISGREDDLIEQRRRARIAFIFGATAVALGVIMGELFLYTSQNTLTLPSWFATLRLILILPIILYLSLWLLQLRAEAFLFEPERREAPSDANISTRDHAAHLRLMHAMEEDKLYRELGLSIGELAQHIDIPEHQLRVLINQGLGYRNFASFLNHYRLLDAKLSLADPELARQPIITVALTVGYASLSTFNRVFKAEEGITPSEYRSEALDARKSAATLGA